MTINWSNINKLSTKEDSFFIHKFLGIFVILHSFYRFYLLFTYNNSFLMEDKYTPLYLILHGLLSVTSFLFHISNNRVKGRPIIYPEFRLHSILFAWRSVVCTLLFYYKFSNIFNIIACFIVMFLADIVTESNKNKNNKTTMRGMPYDTNISEINKKKLNRTYSEMQISATLFVVTNINMAFTPIFAIQLAAFLMTLVKKNIISCNDWHIYYLISLILNILSFVTLGLFQMITLYYCNAFFTELRFNGGYNKYFSWIVTFSIYYLITNILTLEYFNDYTFKNIINYFIISIYILYHKDTFEYLKLKVKS